MTKYLCALLLVVSGCAVRDGSEFLDGGASVVEHSCSGDNDCDISRTGYACEAPRVGPPAGHNWQVGQPICVPWCTDNSTCAIYGLVCNNGTGLFGELHENRCRQPCPCPTDMQCLSNGAGSFCFPYLCSKGCPAGWTCDTHAGICRQGSQCPRGCGQGCSNLCGIGQQCSTNADCLSGLCQNGVCVGSGSCGQNGLTLCNNTYCANLQTDSANCGACGRACGGGQFCSAGNCVTGGGGGGPGTQCTSDANCVLGLNCYSGVCVAPLCVSGVNPVDYTCWGTNGAGDSRGNPAQRQVTVVNGGVTTVQTMYCCSGNDIGSVSTSGAFGGCQGIGEGGSNTVIACHPLRPVGKGYGNGVQR